MNESEFVGKYGDHLNNQQREAVLATDGPVLLLAVPGSGKTTVLVTRLGYMLYCRNGANQSLGQYLDNVIFRDMKAETIAPDASDAAGFEKFMADFKAGLSL